MDTEISKGWSLGKFSTGVSGNGGSFGPPVGGEIPYWANQASPLIIGPAGDSEGEEHPSGKKRNTASQEELRQVPRDRGEVPVQRIVDYRRRLGGFRGEAQWKDVTVCKRKTV